MRIQKNLINNTDFEHNYTHQAKQLYGKPMGTYFFMHLTNGKLALVVSAGGTQIGIVPLEQKGNGEIEIELAKGKQSFKSEDEFINVGKTKGFNCVSFPNKVIKLSFAISELNQTVKPLKYIAGLFISSTPSLNQKIWESEDGIIPEELEDYIFDFEEQQRAARVLEKDPKFKI